MRFLIILSVLLCNLKSYSQWYSLNNGFDYPGRILTYDSINSELIVSGNFIYADSVLVNGIAKWDGNSWKNFDTGAAYGSPVYSITLFQNILFASSLFSLPIPATNWLYKWSGLKWDSIIPSLNGPIAVFKEFNNELYFGGSFSTLGGNQYPLLGKYDGINFSSLNFQANSYSVLALEFYKGNIYIGGNFYDTINFINDIELWDGSQFIGFGGGGTSSSFDYVSSMAIYNNDLYIAGSFTQIGNFHANNIVRWDDSQFYSLGNGINGQISRVKSYSDGIYVCDNFNSAGSLIASGIAKWDGLSWSNVCPNFSNYGINDILKINNDLFITGSFDLIDSVRFNNIAKYSLVNSIEDKNENNLFLYPNPTSELLVIESKSKINEINIVTIKNTLGQILFQCKNCFEDKIEIDATKFTSGIYIVQLIGNDLHSNIKFIKL